MTVTRLLSEADSAELTEWIAWYRVRAEEQEDRERARGHS